MSTNSKRVQQFREKRKLADIQEQPEVGISTSVFSSSMARKHAKDKVYSKREKPVLINEHVFALSDDNSQDYHFVHYTQHLILNYLKNEVKVNVNKVHEFTDGFAGQYKFKHTFGDLSCCLSDFGCNIDRHFFLKPLMPKKQDAAGANIKQRATLSVIR